MTQSNQPWWKQGIIYQIYPKSFQDTTGRGQGDLPGIIRRLDYLKTLGVSAIWLTPIYVSPQIDNGYDVADYCAINPQYGSMDDFDILIQQAHQRQIRIIMDMVFNHTSTQHPWFIAAQQPDGPYRQYYIWRKGTEQTPPNNWRSKFGGSAWHWHASSQQYYLHLFAVEQADLNWEHPPVRAELKAVCEFWADKGVDGLRLDVINLVSKQQDFPTDLQGDGRRFYTDGPRIHQFLQEFNRDVFGPGNLMTVGEMSSTTLQQCQQYGNLAGNELSMTFNFHHLKVDYQNGEKWTLARPDFVELKRLFNQWQQGMHNRAWNALFWCNHDQPRIVSRFGHETTYHQVSAKMLAMVLHGMQGTPYIYQGEEIGMTNPNFQQISDYRDIESLAMYTEKQLAGMETTTILAILAQKSRDNGRTPMQWDASLHAGFSQTTPWLNVADNYRQINVEAALADPDSVFYTYQRLITLRQQFTLLTYADYHDLIPHHPALWCYLRSWQQESLLVIANLGQDPLTFELPKQATTTLWYPLLSNYTDPEKILTQCQLRPYESAYFVSNAKIAHKLLHLS